MGMTNRTTTLSRVDMSTTSRMDVVNEMEVQVCAHTVARICEVDIKARGSTAHCTQNYNGAQVSTSSTHQGIYSVPPPVGQRVHYLRPRCIRIVRSQTQL